MKFTDAQFRHAEERFSEACREVALLWLTFSLLDRLVAGTITFPWILGNGGVAIAAWVLGLYIELRRKAF